MWTWLQVTQKRNREREGGRKKGTIQTDLGESGTPLTLTTEPSRESTSFRHGGIRQDSGTQSRNPASPSLRFCLPALLCGHKMAAAFAHASRQPVFSLLKFTVSTSSCSGRLRSGSPATFKPHGAFCTQNSQGTSPAAHTLQLRSPHKHQFMGPSSKPWEPDLSLPISQMRRLRPRETKVSQDHLCAEGRRTQSQTFRERLG